MVRTSFDAERAYDDDRFATATVFESDRAKVVLGYFEPEQFVPVHAPGSDAAIAVQSGSGTVRDGDVDRDVGPGDVVVVAADTDRGVRASGDERPEALLTTAPPPTDAEHEPVRTGLRDGAFEPTAE